MEHQSFWPCTCTTKKTAHNGKLMAVLTTAIFSFNYRLELWGMPPLANHIRLMTQDCRKRVAILSPRFQSQYNDVAWHRSSITPTGRNVWEMSQGLTLASALVCEDPRGLDGVRYLRQCHNQEQSSTTLGSTRTTKDYVYYPAAKHASQTRVIWMEETKDSSTT
jgi:hypothetical protein